MRAIQVIDKNGIRTVESAMLIEYEALDDKNKIGGGVGVELFNLKEDNFKHCLTCILGMIIEYEPLNIEKIFKPSFLEAMQIEIKENKGK